MKKHLLLVFGMAMTFSSVIMSCTKGDPTYLDPEETAAAIELSSAHSQVTVNNDKTQATGMIGFAGGEIEIAVSSTLDQWDYIVTDENERFNVVKSKNALKISAPENNSPDDSYKMSITVTTGKGENMVTASISVTQSSASPTIYYVIEDPNVTRDDNVLTIDMDNGAVFIEDIIITSNFGDWTFNEDINDIDWISFEKDLSWLVLRVPQNMTYVDRSGTFTLTIGEGAQQQTITVNVAQKKLIAALTIAKTADNKGNITVAANGKSASNSDLPSSGDIFKLAVTSSGAWSYTLSNEDAKINHVSVVDNVLTYTVIPNSSKTNRRNLNLTLFCGEGDNYSEVAITINQRSFNDDYGSDAQPPMVFEITTTEANQQVYLPLYGSINCDIEWGDGSAAVEYAETNPTIANGNMAGYVYAEPGVYYARVSGIVPILNSITPKLTASYPLTTVEYITGILEWGDIGLTNLNNAFYNFTGLKSLPEDDENGAFKKVTNFSGAFTNCTALTSIPKNTFRSVGSEELCTFESVFSGCTALITIEEDLFINGVKITSFAGLFSNCTAIESIPAGLFRNNTAVASFASAFSNCQSLQTIPADLFKHNVAVTSFGSLFSSCKGLTSIPAEIFRNNVNVTNFSTTFVNCDGLTELPEKLFEKNILVDTFANTFQGCTALEKLPEDLFASCPEISTFAYTFSGCTSLSELPAGLFAANTKVNLFTFTFQGCTELKTVPTSIFDNNRAVERWGSMFKDCAKLEGESPYYTGTDPKVHIYNRFVGDEGGTTHVPAQGFHYSSCFTGCTGLTDYLSIPKAWGGGGN